MRIIPTVIWRVEAGGVYPLDVCARIAHLANLLLTRTNAVRLDLLDVQTIVAPEVWPTAPFHYPGLLRAAIRANREAYPRKDGHLYHVMHPPIYSGRYAFFGGTAGCVGCIPDNWLTCASAGVVSTLLNPTPDDHIRSCAYIMAHEIAHCFGASHIQDGKIGTVMHPYINMWNKHRGIRWAKKSKQEIKKFVEGL